MSRFDLYANYYDLLYADKNYEAEASYVDAIIKQHRSQKNPEVLDLGCGTGKHDFSLMNKGYRITGVDLSPVMVSEANKAQLKLFPGTATNFFVGDARSFRNEQKYDAVISLFHVASYQSTNEDIMAMFGTAKDHLKEDGIFVFDCWYGPAVLTHRPETRIKRLHNEEIAVRRLAEPEFYPNQNLVDVNYEVIINHKKTGTQETVNEKHTMRYFFLPEILLMCEQAGLQFISCKEWMSDKMPGFDSWNVVIVCKNSKHA